MRRRSIQIRNVNNNNRSITSDIHHHLSFGSTTAPCTGEGLGETDGLVDGLGDGVGVTVGVGEEVFLGVGVGVGPGPSAHTTVALSNNNINKLRRDLWVE